MGTNMKESKIIYVDNKPHIKCDVVMLPIEISKLFPGVILLDKLSNKLSQSKTGSNFDILGGYRKPQHLYFTSDEEIKEGDWCYNSISNGLEKWSYKGWIEAPDFEYLGYKKVIATTDTSLGLPQPSQQFIEKWIEEYNKGNQITEVLIEVEKKWINSKGEIGNNFNSVALYEESIKEFDARLIHQLKLDSQNQITIRKQKDNWSREEVIELCKKSYILGCNNQQTFNNNLYSEIKKKEISFIEWIEKNL